MNILVLNSGSSSIKCALFEFSCFPDQYISPVWNTKIEWKNTQEFDVLNLKNQLLPLLSEKKVNCIGHRIVHGGNKYKKSITINSEIKRTIHSLSNLAPLHNSADVKGIEALEKIFPNVMQIAVFDTAFHHTLPKAATIYPGPYEWVEKGIYRFGFHGISFQYCSRAAAQILRTKIEKMVICHLGSGASLCAVRNGKSIDTTMGFTPLEGVMMDTRSGTVDPGIILHLLEQKTLSELTQELYQRSGLLGLSGVSSDMRDVLQKSSEGNVRAQLALDVYLHRLVSFIGSMIASLDGIDVLVFTAGVGENAPFIRKEVCKRLSFLGIKLKELESQGDQLLSTPSSKVSVLLIHTQEEFEIARECWRTMKETQKR